MPHTNRNRWIAIALLLLRPLLPPGLAAQSASPEILAISPASGPEGTPVEITGRNFQNASQVLFGGSTAVFQIASAQKLIAIVPHKLSTAPVTVITPQGRSSAPVTFAVSNDPRIPDEASYKAGYVNPSPPPAGFSSARLWGIAIADTRVPGHASAQVEIAWTRLSCRIEGRDVLLNDDGGQVQGGLYGRDPWFANGGFATDAHDPIPLSYNPQVPSVVLAVGRRPDRIWHFWSPSPRALLPQGRREGCTVEMKVRISSGALLQVGMDYWRSPTIPYGPGGNNREAGASRWYFPSPQWQTARFTDVGGPQF